MLKHKLIACLSILLLALAACGDEPDDDNGNNDTTNNDTTNNDTTNNDTTNNDTTNNDTPGGELDLESFLNTSVAYDNKYFGYICECFWEENEFDSQAECEEAALASPADIEAFGSCAQGLIDDADPAPQSVIDHFECLEGNIEDSEACFDAVDDTDWCSDETALEVEECDEITYGELGDDCDALLDEDGDAWLADLDEEIEANCLQ